MHESAAASAPIAVADVVMSASRALLGVAARSLAQVEDQVTLPQYRALVVLAGRGQLRPVDLAAALEVDPSTATRMCDRLVRKGLIERSHRQANRREVELRLSAEGTALLRQVTRRRQRDFRRILARVPSEAHGELVHSLDLFTQAAGEIPDSAWSLGFTP